MWILGNTARNFKDVKAQKARETRNLNPDMQRRKEPFLVDFWWVKYRQAFSGYEGYRRVKMFLGSRRKDDMVQVLESPLFINYHHYSQDHGNRHSLTCVICSSSYWPQSLCPPRGHPAPDRHIQGWQSIFACPGLGNTAKFLLLAHSASWPTPSPDTLGYIPVRHWRSWCKPSGSEDVHSSNHVLPTDGTFIHALATLGTGYHVSTLQ